MSEHSDDHECNDDCLAEQLGRFLQAVIHSSIINEKLGAPLAQVMQVVPGPTPPAPGWEKIECSGCDDFAWAPPGMKDHMAAALCPACQARAAEL